jgi:hypothetical protein
MQSEIILDYKPVPFLIRLFRSLILPLLFITIVMIIMAQNGSIRVALVFGLTFLLFFILFGIHRSRYYITKIVWVPQSVLYIEYLDFNVRKELNGDARSLSLYKGLLWSKNGRFPYLNLISNDHGINIKQYGICSWQESTMDDVASKWPNEDNTANKQF